MIGIRADANEIIATGHIMRCIAIARQLEKLKEQVVFITADDFATNLLQQRGYQSICLHTKWNKKDEETNRLIQCIHENKIEKLIIDSYEVTKTYLENIKKHTKVIYLDDIYKFEYPVDALINYSIGVDEKRYNYLGEQALKLLGSTYTPLREEFEGEGIERKEKVSDILITTGGSDNLFIIEKIIKRVSGAECFKDLSFHVVIGAFFQNKRELISLAQKESNIVLHQNVTNMAEIMKVCDIAISAGGTTLAELSSLGIPTISFAVADNQLDGINAYEAKALMPTVGDVRSNIDQAVEDILEWLKKLVEEKELRENIAQSEMKFIDGKGAARIAKALKIL